MISFTSKTTILKACNLKKIVVEKDVNEKNFTDLLSKILVDQNEYFSKKNNLAKLTKENTWELNKSKLTKLLNEN